MLIKNTTVLNFSDLSTLENTDVLIEGSLIKKIGKNLEGDEIIDGSNFYTAPGLANTHAHVAMALLRGSAEDVTASEWFNDYIWIYEKNLKPEDVYFGTLLGASEMLLAGITTVFDHYFAMDWAFKAYKEIGMRADLAWAVFGKGGDAEKGYKSSLEFIEKFSGLDDRITISLGPHSPYICSEDFLKEIADISRESGLKIHIHVSEEAWQVKKSLLERGKTPIQYLNDLGLMKENTILAHAYYATPQDLGIVKSAGAKIAHAPKTYLRFGDLNDFLPKAIEKGVTVGFATDGPASNGNLSIFEVARIAALLSKTCTRDAHKGKIEEIVPLLSSTQKFLNKPLGKVKEGYLADLILIKKDSPRLNPQTNIFANILYSISEKDIDTVIVDGKIVVKEGKLLTIDVGEVIKEANKIAKRIVKRTSDKPMQTFG